MLSRTTVLVGMTRGLYGHAPIGTLISFRKNPRFTKAIVTDRGNWPQETGHARLRAQAMLRGAPPLSPGDVVISDHRIPPFYKDETLVVDEVKNLGTRGNPHWRAHLRSPRGVSGWLDATSLIRL